MAEHLCRPTRANSVRSSRAGASLRTGFEPSKSVFQLVSRLPLCGDFAELPRGIQPPGSSIAAITSSDLRCRWPSLRRLRTYKYEHEHPRSYFAAPNSTLAALTHE